MGTPDASTFWRIVEEYKVNTLFTAPTALRAIRRDDPDNDCIGESGRRGGMKSLRALFLAGERSEPSIVTMYQHLLEKYGAEDALVVDNWWSSESGSPITGLAQMAGTGIDFNSTGKCESLRMKPGSAGKPMPGFDVKIVDDEGKDVETGKMGNIVLGIPLAPTGMTSLWNDEERFYRGYLKRFDSKFIDTGDAGMIDEDGSCLSPPETKTPTNLFVCNRICSRNVSRRRYHKRSRPPFLHWRNRTSYPLPSLHRRSMRHRHTRCNERTPPLRFHLFSNTPSSYPCRPRRNSFQRSECKCKGANWWYRCIGGNDPRREDDSKDEEWEDA